MTAPDRRDPDVTDVHRRRAPSGAAAAWRVSTVVDGDFAIDGDAPALAARRQAFVPGRWVWLRQVHGDQVHRVTAATAATIAGRDGDALVTADPGLVLAVQTADCVPVVLTGRAGDGPTGEPDDPGHWVVGVAHAGWRGTEAGVVEATVAALRALGAHRLEAVIGPCIRPECYEFGAADLDRLAARFGPAVRATTAWGTPAVDVARAVQVVLDRLGVTWTDTGACTACDADRWFSHRARGQTGRQVTAVWIEPDPPSADPLGRADPASRVEGAGAPRPGEATPS